MKGFGHVVQCRSKVNNHGECSGYVCFGTAEVAQAAMDGLRKSPSKFRVKFWDPSSANVRALMYLSQENNSSAAYLGSIVRPTSSS